MWQRQGGLQLSSLETGGKHQDEEGGGSPSKARYVGGWAGWRGTLGTGAVGLRAWWPDGLVQVRGTCWWGI